MKILVIEDEHRIAQAIKKGLEQEHYVVDLAYEGETGLDLALDGLHDLIITDVMLPKMDGIELTQKIRAHGLHVPVLILTARGQVTDRVVGLNAGADDYLGKPFAFEELLARIRALLRRPRQVTSTVLRVGDLELDAVTFKVSRDGKCIHLSSKEFSLLEFLMRHAGKILKKEQIIENLWDYDANILPNTIEVYIRHLREKIDSPFKNKKPLIHTVRGFGYKIEE